MTDQKANIGTVTWADLTVMDAPRIAEFYHAVAGWQPKAMEVHGGDFCMNLPGTSTTAAGICYARGQNAAIPPQWIIYVAVKDLKASIDACKRLGGEVVCDVCGGSGCVIRDPAGAVMAIMQA